MQKKVKITSDSTCDLSPELIAKYDIGICPLFITLDDEYHRDGVDITPDDVYAFYDKTGRLAKSAAANIADYTDFWEAEKEGYDELIHFNISSTMSATHNNARMAAEEMDGIYAVASANLSTGSGLLVLKAAELANEGKSAAEIVEAIDNLRSKVDASFVIDSLTYLHKGGRCSTLAALGANVLKLKPCIEVKNGSMGVGKKYRGRFDLVLKDYVADRLANGDDIDLDRVFVTHAGCDEEVVNNVVEMVKETLPFKELLITRAGCTVSAHCGRNTLGVLFIRKSDLQ